MVGQTCSGRAHVFPTKNTHISQEYSNIIRGVRSDSKRGLNPLETVNSKQNLFFPAEMICFGAFLIFWFNNCFSYGFEACDPAWRGELGGGRPQPPKLNEKQSKTFEIVDFGTGERGAKPRQTHVFLNFLCFLGVPRSSPEFPGVPRNSPESGLKEGPAPPPSAANCSLDFKCDVKPVFF